MKKIIKVFAICAIILTSITASSMAQSMQLPDKLGSLTDTVNSKPTTISIYNESQNDIKLLIGETINLPDTVIILKNSQWTGGPYEKDPLIRIKTGNIIKQYFLVLGNDFLIFWDNDKKCWDIKLIEN